MGQSPNQSPEQSQMAKLIVDVLNLEDIKADEIDPDAIMFAEEGLGLDSIDALEIAVAIADVYNVQLTAEDESTKEVFSTLGKLTAYVMQESNRNS